jgi:hypothetical protein
MAQKNDYLAVGKEQGAVIAKYLIERITDGRLTPGTAVEVAASHVAKQAELMQAEGTSRDDMLVWIAALNSAVHDSISGSEKSR